MYGARQHQHINPDPPTHPFSRANRYKLLGYGLSSNPPATDQTCRKIMEKANLQGFQVGKTKVFMRYFHQDQLNDALRPYPTSATVMQKGPLRIAC
jgi:hypothetical protein